MESHKRILGILYIISGILKLFALALVATFLSTLFPYIAQEAGPDGAWAFEWIGNFIPVLLWGIIILFAVPSVIGGIAMLQQKSWALTLLLILGCFKLFSFPIGTALGVYTIWVYAESNKK